MDDHARQLVQKLWNFCNLLRDDGLSYGDYLERLSTKPPPGRLSQDKRDAIAAALTAWLYDEGHCEEFGQLVVPKVGPDRALGA